ncbi:MAG TPA: hypothetical protein PLC79_00415 [Phycisphaerae bacterium]|nr:hypothetical protein [Phycisphaerae bacterium]
MMKVTPVAALILLLGPAVVTAVADLAGDAPIRPGSSPAATRPGAGKYLLLESDRIERADGVRLVLGKVAKDAHNPLLVEDKPWEVRFDNLYATVMFDEERRVYRAWYNPFIIDDAVSSTTAAERKKIPYRPTKREMGVCYAVSQDGIAWEKPALGIVEFNGTTANNLVMRDAHGTGVRMDPLDPDAARRYKAFLMGGVATSPDGLHWSKTLPCPEINAAGDTHNNWIWDDARGRYVGITRLWADRQRIVGRTESADFRKWSPAVEVLRGDVDHQTYALVVFRYANVYLGLLMIHHRRPDTVDCELAWSRDTIRWERVCAGTPLIPRGREGEFDSHCLFAAAEPISRDGEIRLYYGGNNGPHFGWQAGGLGLARLRPDGFAGMAAAKAGELGTIVTKPIPCAGRHLQVTADVGAGGSVRASVVDADGFALADGEAIGTDVTDGTVRWRDGRDLGPCKGKPVRLRFELRAATLYAFRFTD